MSSRGRLLVSLAIAEGERAVDNTSDGTNQSNQQGDSVKETPDDGLRQSGLTTDIGPAVETQIEGFEHMVFYSQPGETAANKSCSRTSIPSSTTSSSTGSSSSSSSTSNDSSPEDNEDSSNDITYEPENEENLGSNSSEDNLRVKAQEKSGGNPRGSTPSYIQLSSSSNSNSTTTNNSMDSPMDVPILVSPVKKGVKRKRNVDQWKRNVLKKARNSGEAYQTHSQSKSIRGPRKLKPPCGQHCKLKCSTKFTAEERMQLFSTYWALGDLNKQRDYIKNSMETIMPRYRYTRVGGTRNARQHNNAFYFNKNNQKIRVCKVFFRNTLDINDRPIRTVQNKRNKVAGAVIEPDLRGKHGMHRSLDPAIREGVRKHIDSIPKIESHYTRANTTRQFIDGSKSLADIHRDYKAICEENKEPFASYAIFQQIFTQEFNISFFTPKKDKCVTCVAYENANEGDKELLKINYDQDLEEKQLSRTEKMHDKENFEGIVAVYDLQAVTQIPKGNASIFYYKSKLNVLNFTIYDLQKNLANVLCGMNPMGTEALMSWVRVYICI
ncbi:uncharacterized protein [Rhodnius prolixus]|uniref:uncharacterized protein n=1 Tax=Rhodnius prolixus TaxID=13249 RepID=UPI003D1890AC